MGFTSVVFLFLFAPISVIAYYAMCLLEKITVFKKLRVRDLVLVCISIAFYGWAGLDGIIFICSNGIYNWTGNNNYTNQEEQ